MPPALDCPSIVTTLELVAVNVMMVMMLETEGIECDLGAIVVNTKRILINIYSRPLL